MTAFACERVVRFADTDPAGIVFYPRYFEMINGVVEDWFADGVGYDFRRMHLDDRRGLPTVHLDADFLRPSRLGDRLIFRLQVGEVRGSSITVRVLATGDDGERFRCRLVLALIDLDSGRPVRIPDLLRMALERFGEGTCEA